MSKSETKEYTIGYKETLNWEDDFQWMDLEVAAWVLDLYRLIWDLEPAPVTTQLKHLELIDELYRRHQEDEYISEDASYAFPEDTEELRDLADKLEVIQLHAQYMSLLETMQIELLAAFTDDIRCNEIYAFPKTLDKWIDATRDSLSNNKEQ